MFTPCYQRYTASGHQIGEGEAQEVAEFWDYCHGKALILYCFVVWRGKPDCVDTVLRAMPEESQSFVGVPFGSSSSSRSSSNSGSLCTPRAKKRQASAAFDLTKLAEQEESEKKADTADRKSVV